MTHVLPDLRFRVERGNGHEVMATIAGKMRRYRIRVLEEDWVTVRSPVRPPMAGSPTGTRNTLERRRHR
jgi:hypothetical protein